MDTGHSYEDVKFLGKNHKNGETINGNVGTVVVWEQPTLCVRLVMRFEEESCHLCT